MLASHIVMLVLLGWVAIACWCLFAALWDLAKEDFRQ